MDFYYKITNLKILDNWPKFKTMNIRIGKISQWLPYTKLSSPYLSFCLKCNTTWSFVKCKEIRYDTFSFHFALCKKCFSESSIEERIFFYTKSDFIGNSSNFKKSIINNIISDSGVDYKQYFRKKSLEKILN